MTLYSSAVPQTRPIDHGAELLRLLGVEPTPLPTELAEELIAIAAIQDESAAAIQTAARRPLIQVDRIRREENDGLTDRAIELALPADLSLVDAMAMITAIQTRHALMRETTGANSLKAVDGRIFRRKRKDVYHPGQTYLPLVEGRHVAEGLKLLINELDTEFDDGMDIETAVIKACVYLNLAMILHPQRDFNNRVNRSFFDYLLSKTQPDQNSLRVFRNAHDHFKATHLFPAREYVRFTIFANRFPDLASNPMFQQFVEKLYRKLFSHTMPYSEAYASVPGIAADQDGIFSNIWVARGARGVKKEDVDEALTAMDLTDSPNTEEIFRRVKAMKKFDSQAVYFSEALQASRAIIQELLRYVAPVIRIMRERGLQFIYYHFNEVYRELNKGRRPDIQIRSSIELVLWAMRQLKIHCIYLDSDINCK